MRELKTRQIRIAVTWAAQFQLFAAAVPRDSIRKLFSMSASAAARRFWLCMTWPTFYKTWRKSFNLASAPATMWRYDPVLPADRQDSISLGEGFTPLLSTPRLGAKLGVHDLWVKDDGQNPTASFKARGMSAAVTMAKKLGAAKLAAPSAGNAGGALAAYAAAAAMEAHIFMPSDVPQSNYIECRASRGARNAVK